MRLFFSKNKFLKILLVLVSFSTQAQILTINFSIPTGTVPAFFYSLNIWDGVTPTVSNDVVYKQRIDSLKLSIVRYHSQEIYTNGSPRCWVNYTMSAWNATAVTTALSTLQGKVQNRIIDIPNFPLWLNNNTKYIPVSMAPQFGKWCADLVRIVNKQSPYYTKYWEVFNELEANYVGQTTALATIYNTAVDSMKAVDSTIRVGAFSISHPYWSPNDQKTFYQNAAPRLDFVTYHHYGSANSNISNSTIYNNAKNLSVAGANNIRSLMNQVGLPSTMPLWLGEANIVWTWTGDTLMKKQRSGTGAVFDALLLTHALRNSTGRISSMQLFNERDGVYGKLSQTNVKRPAYHLLKYLSNNCYGTVKQFTTTTSDTIVFGHAVSNNSGDYIQIINRSPNVITPTLTISGLANTIYSIERTAINDTLKISNFTFQGSSLTQTLAPETVVFLKLVPVSTTTFFETNLEDNIIHIFPNPSSSGFEIASEEKIESIFIYNVQGKFIKKIIITEIQKNIRIEGLPSDTYQAKIMLSNGKKLVKRIIVE
jgi:hypothetical protein